MGGGLLQLVAYGAQDVYLTGNPQITFFKVVYRRHTNFALESIQQTFNGNVGFGSRVTSTISRNGDLINRAYLVVKCNNITNACPYFGLRLIKNAEVEIGGQKIDKHYSEWMYIWNELSLPYGKKDGYFEMVGGSGGDLSDKYLHIPFEFWFCRNIGLSLPLIGLQYHEVKINIQFESDSNLGVKQSDRTNEQISGNFDASLWVDYVYLDTDERRKFAQSSHEYLIEQLQYTGKESAVSKIKLNFNHPVKELIWTVSNNTSTNLNWFNYTNESSDTNSLFKKTNSEHPIDTYDEIINVLGPNSGYKNPISSGKLSLNGNDRFSSRDGTYFNLIQTYQHHENIPNNVGINVYSFALKPEEHQPSGTLNMSRIDTATLDLKYSNLISSTGYSTSIYATNYNVLRILSGMGGIAYSN
tara:strand:- start:416 stop:1657 length:1242 start_codon:yes stop_codon:yes gene_type:complete